MPQTLISAPASSRPRPAAGGEIRRPAILPLPQVSARALASVNVLYRRRSPLAAKLAAEPVTLAASWPPPAERPDDCLVSFFVEGEPGALRLPRSRVERWLNLVAPEASLERLAPAEAALLLECALARDIEALEAALGRTVSVAAVTGPQRSEAGELRCAFTIAGADGESWACSLDLPAEVAGRLGMLLDRLAAVAPAAFELPVPVAVGVGAAELRLGELRDLRPGDVVLADEVRAAGAAALAVFGRHLVAPVTLTAQGARLEAAPQRIRGSEWEWIMNETPQAVGDAAPEDGGLDDLPVRLVFEVGRAELPLGDLRTLASGALLPLSRTPDEAVDIVANGKRIGRGELVRIGEALGVRVTRISDDA